VTITTTEHNDIARANHAGVTPIVLIHGLWLPGSSWLPWRGYLEELGFATLAPGWPGVPDLVADARAHPETQAGKGISDVTEHYAEVIRALDRTPVLIGQSLGGLVAQRLAGEGLAAATVALGPSPFRGVLPLAVSTLRATAPVLARPGAAHRTVMLSESQFRYVFGNAIPAAESAELYQQLCIPGPARPLLQSATASLNPLSEARVDTARQDRGPLLLVAGEKDNTVPWSLAYSAYQRQAGNPNRTEIALAPGRGHSMAADHGWQEVADNALAFLTDCGVRP
jgi:pimeloyl-ACP methyl ester carboxylesterase